MEAEFIVSNGDALYAVVDLGIYSQTALLKVAHFFTGKCFVHLESQANNRVEVRFTTKKPGLDLSPIVGEFLNALLDQTLRELVGQETEPVRNLILAHALSNTSLIHPELEIVDPSSDPNSIGLQDAKKTDFSKVTV